MIRYQQLGQCTRKHWPNKTTNCCKETKQAILTTEKESPDDAPDCNQMVGQVPDISASLPFTLKLPSKWARVLSWVSDVWCFGQRLAGTRVKLREPLRGIFPSNFHNKKSNRVARNLPVHSCKQLFKHCTWSSQSTHYTKTFTSFYCTSHLSSPMYSSLNFACTNSSFVNNIP